MRSKNNRDLHRLSRLIAWLPLLVLASLPIFWKIGPPISFTGNYYEIFELKPLAPIHLILMVSITTIALYFSMTIKKTKIPITYLVFAFYLPMVVIFNSDVMLYRDILLHGTAPKNILSSGHIAPIPLRMDAEWPAANLLWATMAQILNLDIVTTNILLYLVCQSLLATVIFLIGRSIIRDLNYPKRYTEIFATLTILLMTNHYNIFVKFGDSIFGYAIFLFLILLLIKNSIATHNNKSLQTKTLPLELVIYIFLLYLHPFYATVYLCIAATLSLIQFRNRRRFFSVARNRVMFITTSYIAYLIYQARTHFNQVLSRIAYGELIESERQFTLQSFSIEEPLPIYGVYIRQTFKVLLIILGLVSLFTILSKRREISKYKFLAIGHMTGAIVLLVIFYYVPGYLGRAVFFITLPLSILSTFFFYDKMKNLRGSTVILSVLIALIALTTFSLAFEPPILGRSITPSILAGASFAVNNSRKTIYTLREPPTPLRAPIDLYMYHLTSNSARISPVRTNVSDAPSGLIASIHLSEDTSQQPISLVYSSTTVKIYYKQALSEE